MSDTEKLTYLEPKLIGKLFRFIPSDYLLSHAGTQAQIRCWLNDRQFFLCLAAAWVGEQNFQDDPLYPLKEAGVISEACYTLAWLLLARYQRIWTLVRTTYPFLKAEAKRAGVELPFASAYDLYSYIVKDEADWQTELTQLPYAEFSAPKMAKAMKLVAKEHAGEDLTLIQRKKFSNLVPKGTTRDEATWFHLVLAIAHKKANKRNRLLKYALEDYNTNMARICREMAAIAKQRRSVAVKHGNLMTGSRGGKYTSEP